MQLATEGSFLCEVSGEAPLFQTAKKQNFLTVVGKQQAEQAIIMFFVEYHARGMPHSPCNPRKLEYLHEYPS